MGKDARFMRIDELSDDGSMTSKPFQVQRRPRMARPVRVVSANDLQLGNEAELEAFIGSLLAEDEAASKVAPLPILAPAPSTGPIPPPAAAKRAPFHCHQCGALRKGHQCVAFRPHEGKKKQKTSKAASKSDPAPPSTDSLLASMGTPEGRYDVHRLDSAKLARFRELLHIWRTRSVTQEPVSLTPDLLPRL